MKNYTITVNGNTYEVTVEEGFRPADSAAPVAAAKPAAPAVKPAAQSLQVVKKGHGY